jgi:hypothetical protein
LLRKYGDDLAAAWRDYPSPKDKAARDAQIAKLDSTFNQDIGMAQPITGMSVSKAIDGYLDYIDEARNLFKTKELETVKSNYMHACDTVFKKEIAAASDLGASLPTQQCFENLMDMLTNARVKLAQTPVAARTRIFNDINAAMDPLFSNAKPPERGDPIAQYDSNLREAQNRFPTSTDTLKKLNNALRSILEGRAKQIKDKSK